MTAMLLSEHAQFLLSLQGANLCMQQAMLAMLSPWHISALCYKPIWHAEEATAIWQLQLHISISIHIVYDVYHAGIACHA